MSRTQERERRLSRAQERGESERAQERERRRSRAQESKVRKVDVGEEKKCEKEFGLKEREKIARKKTQNWVNG